MKNSNALILAVLLLTALASAETAAQQATPTPTPAPAARVVAGNYDIISSIEFGVRGASVDGNHDKYRSDLNYQPGFRLFDSSFLARAREGRGGLFDTLVVNSSGFNADPSGSVRVNAEKGRWYRFDANFRRSAYDNRLRNLALGQHISQNKHKFGDFDLRLLPHNRNVRFNLGYSMDRNSNRANGTTTYDIIRDEFQVAQNVKTRADEYRAGVEGRIGALDLGFLQGVRLFRDDTSFFSGPNAGNNRTNTSVLATLRHDQPTRGRTWFSRLSAHANIARRVDLTGRYTYANTTSDFQIFETYSGINGSNQVVVSDTTAFSGRAERPSHLGDFGLTWQATEKFRISETLRFNTFRNEGDELFDELLFLRTRAGAPVLPFPNVTRANIERVLEYRRFHNQLEADYQFGPRLSVHAGYRFVDRHIEISGTGRILPTPVSSTAAFDEVTDTQNHSFFAGFRARPVKTWTMYFDFERGEADNVFTRVDNFNTVNFRVRNRIQPSRRLTLNLSFVSRDNSNPGVAVRDRTLFGTLDATPFSVESDMRIFTSSVDWLADERLTLSGGFTHTRLDSDAEILFFAALPGGRFVTGRSLFFMRDSFFFFNAQARLHSRVTGFAGYRVHHDTGQGERPLQPDASTFVRSYPYTFHAPEARIAVRLNRRLDWNIGYQYYGYNERIAAQQNYRAHLPYTSLRIYFGGGGDR